MPLYRVELAQVNTKPGNFEMEMNQDTEVRA